MALIECPECGHDVSTFAQACPNCGYPMGMSCKQTPVENVACVIRGEPYDFSEALKLSKMQDIRIVEVIKAIRQVADMGLEENKRLAEIIVRDKAVPKEFDTKKRPLGTPTQNITACCPTCKSTDVTKLGVGSRAISGFIFGGLSPEGRAQFRCNKCGYMW